MRLWSVLFIGIAFLSTGCSTTSVMGISGGDWVPLSTRDQVHEALGLPAKVDVAEGKSFEEFQVRGGCEQVVFGCRMPAFQPLEEFHIQGWCDLQLVSVNDIGSMPAKARSQMVVANINNALHFRICDENGNAVVDTDEAKLASKARSIGDLKNQLENLWTPHKLSEEEKHRIIAAVVSIVGRNPLGSFELAVGNVKTYGLVQIGTLPDGPKAIKSRVLPGQTLRFEFDHLGNVRKVYADGELLLSVTKYSDAPLAFPTAINQK